MNVNTYVVAESFEDAYQRLIENRKNKILGGGAWLKLSVKDVNQLISLEKLGLDQIQVNDQFIEIGAMVSLRDIEMNQAIKQYHSGILNEAISSIMGIAIRNLATIGGSVMGRFSFSDLMAVLLVMDAKVVLHKHGECLLETFLSDRSYSEDILKSIIIPKRDTRGYYKKVAVTALDFSIVNLAILKDDGIKIAVGSRPGMAKLAKKSMDYINQQDHINDEVIRKMAELAIEELELGQNIRGSKVYREALVETYLKRGLRQVLS